MCRVGDPLDLLRATMAHVKAEGGHVARIEVGELRVQFARPWPEPAAPERTQADAVVEDDQSVTPELRRLRAASRKQFGRVLPDALLLEFAGQLGH